MSSKDYIYCYQGSALRVAGGTAVIGKKYDPYNPLGLPPLTVRTKWASGYTPTLGTTNTLVDPNENIWDIYVSSTIWNQKFSSSSVKPNLLEVIGANTHDVTSINRCFLQCTNLTSVCSMDLSSATSCTSLFNGCSGLVSVGDIKLGSATLLQQMFMGCSSLVTSPKLTGTRNVTQINAMFYGCSSLTNVTSFDTSSVTSFGAGYGWGNAGMFTGCTSLVSIPDTFNTAAGTSMAYMFKNCTSLTSVPLFDTGSCQYMSSMFEGCESLTTVPLFDTRSCTYMGYMFYGCVNVQSGALALYQQASAQATPPSDHSDAFYQCGSLTETGAAELAQIPTSWGGTMAE